jgi:hypothetical protein
MLCLVEKGMFLASGLILTLLIPLRVDCMTPDVYWPGHADRVQINEGFMPKRFAKSL